jgi:hypothetical protein
LDLGHEHSNSSYSRIGSISIAYCNVGNVWITSDVSPTHTICDIGRHHLIGLAIFLALKIATPIEYITNQYSVFNAFQQFRTLSILVGVT